MNVIRVLGAAVSIASLAACTISSDDPNAQVDAVTLVGTSVTSELYSAGAFGVRTIPTKGDGSAVLSNNLAVNIRVSSPAGVTVSVDKTECNTPDPGSSVNVGVIIDDSGSMSSSDPSRKRKDAVLSFLKTLRDKDAVLLTDYGQSSSTGKPLRDLVCASSGGGSCAVSAQGFTSDRAALEKAADLIRASGGTPLFESCVQMLEVMDGVKSGRRAVLLLSDGQPNSMTQRDACHSAAKAAQIPVYTVGLGPAAEGDKGANDTAVKVLRELASDTSAAYASADIPEQLDRLFVSMGAAVTKGSCSSAARVSGVEKILPGTRVKGEIEVGAKGAKTPFEFVAPKK